MEQKKNNINNIFIKILMKHGKKSVSEKIFKNILIFLKKQTKQKPNFILKKTIFLLSPKIKLINIKMKKKKRKKNKFFLIYLKKEQQIKLSIFWLLKSSRNQSKNLIQNISNEIIKTYYKKSKSLEIKKTMYNEIKKLKYNIIF